MEELLCVNWVITDRLVGAANLSLKCGFIPVYLCMGIASALKYGRELLSVRMLLPMDSELEQRHGWDEAVIWAPADAALRGNMDTIYEKIPRTDMLFITQKKVSKTAFLSLLEVRVDENPIPAEVQLLGECYENCIATGDGSVGVVGLRRKMRDATDLVLFRKSGGNLAAGVDVKTDGGFIFVGKDEGLKFLVSEGSRVVITEIEYLNTSRPVFGGLKYDQSSLRGQINVLTDTEVSLYVPGKPVDVAVTGVENSHYHFQKDRLSLLLKRGSYFLKVGMYG